MTPTPRSFRRLWSAVGPSAVVLLAACTNAPAPVAALTPPATPAEVTTMVDRAAIENLFADYYSHFGTGPFDFSRYFAADGVLDVNGLVATGADEIRALYVRAGGGTGEAPSRDPAAPPPGRFQMQLTNLKVDVNGDAATAEMFWSSLLADTLVGPPRVTEYGRDRAELVKHDGRWLIQHRVVTSYGGMPEGLLKSYVPR